MNEFFLRSRRRNIKVVLGILVALLLAERSRFFQITRCYRHKIYVIEYKNSIVIVK